MTTRVRPDRRQVRTPYDSIVDRIEIAIDEWSMTVLDAIRAEGYAEPVAWRAITDARDVIIGHLVAEDERLALLERLRAGREISGALQPWR